MATVGKPMGNSETRTVWIVVRLRRGVLGNKYAYWGTYASEIEATKVANFRNYRGAGYLETKEKFFAYRVDLTPDQFQVLRELSEGGREHSVLRFSPDPRD